MAPTTNHAQNSNSADYEAYQNQQMSDFKPTFDFKGMVMVMLQNWYWFVICMAIALGVAVFYLASTPKSYTRRAAILIKDDNSGNSGSASFSDIALGKSKVNIENESRTFKSPILMHDVVLRLDLNNEYHVKNAFRTDRLYKQSPVVVMPRDTGNNTPFSMTLRVNKNGTVKISDVEQDNITYPQEINARLGQTVKLPGGMVVTLLKPEWDGSQYLDKNIQFTHKDLDSYANAYASGISAMTESMKTSIITLRVSNQSKELADDLLATLMQVYNEQWLEDKNQVAVATSNFINERLNVIELELGNVDSDISSYKSANLVPDVQQASQMFMQESMADNQAIYDLSNQIGMARLMRVELQKGTLNEILPATSGINNAGITSIMNEYNTIVMERNRLLATSSEKNPVVSDLTAQLRPLRNNILRSLDTYIQTLTTQMNNAQARSDNNIARIAANPNQEKHLLSIERQQKVKESLYLYLLQKREENQLSQAFTAYNTRIIENPTFSKGDPDEPQTTKVLTLAIAIGFLIPLLYFYLSTFFDNKVHNRNDLRSTSIPYLGEIPMSTKSQHGIKKTFERLRKKNLDKKHEIVVTAARRDVVNEAFRVLRTNLEFLCSSDENNTGKADVIAVTSSNPGSGKTFITLNLASVLAIKDKRVLSIDLDLRRGSLSNYFKSPKPGITDYLSGHANHEDIIRHDINNIKGYDVICVGTLPPNPAELLASGKLDRLIDGMRDKYDYILLDCPPVEIVTDTLVINRVADRTLFVVRAGLFHRDTLFDIEEFYRSGRYRNLVLLLNGTDNYGGYGYHSQHHDTEGYIMNS